MGALVVGLSHRTAPMGLLERTTLDESACRGLEKRLCTGEYILEAMVLSTCNRLEVYASAEAFHGGLNEIGQALTAATGLDLESLTPHLYVHYEAAAVAHLFSLTAGLDSMAVGEQQILGQVRAAMRGAQQAGSAQGELLALLQQGLRVGKRAHSETALDTASRSLVEASLIRAKAVLGPLDALKVLVVGAGAMSGLTVATLRREGIGALTVVNRTLARAQRLAEAASGLARPLDELAAALTEADLIICSAGAAGHLIGRAEVENALADRAAGADGVGGQVYVDLALPRDVDPEVADLDGVTLVDLEMLGRELAGPAASLPDVVERARDLVHDEALAFLTLRDTALEVGPTVVALRGMAAQLVEAELSRLRSRLTGRADPGVVTELEQTVNRVVDKLLHTPTVRIKELAADPDGPSYAQALRELFDLDPSRVAAVTQMSEPEGGGP